MTRDEYLSQAAAPPPLGPMAMIVLFKAEIYTVRDRQLYTSAPLDAIHHWMPGTVTLKVDPKDMGDLSSPHFGYLEVERGGGLWVSPVVFIGGGWERPLWEALLSKLKELDEETGRLEMVPLTRSWPDAFPMYESAWRRRVRGVV